MITDWLVVDITLLNEEQTGKEGVKDLSLVLNSHMDFVAYVTESTAYPWFITIYFGRS